MTKPINPFKRISQLETKIAKLELQIDKMKKDAEYTRKNASNGLRKAEGLERRAKINTAEFGIIDFEAFVKIMTQKTNCTETQIRQLRLELDRLKYGDDD